MILFISTKNAFLATYTKSVTNGYRYWKGGVKKGIRTLQEGVKALNTAQGVSSTIGSGMSAAVNVIKTFSRNLWGL